MNDWLMEIIRCPVTGEALSVADQAIVDSLLSQMRSGQLFSHKGIAIQETFQGGLVNRSGTLFYRVQDNIPTLLPDEAIRLGE